MAAAAPVVPVASGGLVASSEAEMESDSIADLPEKSNSTMPTGTVPVWQALLDIQMWRPRPWWIRLAASLVVKRRP
jgi:hypothetical protein